MMDTNLAVQKINEYIIKMGKDAEEELCPVEFNDLMNNHKLCGILIDFLGDIYICHGIDINDRDNQLGTEIQQLITFLAGLVPEKLG